MLLDERQAALNDVVLACREAAEHYREAAGSVADQSLAARFHDFGRRHEAFAAELGNHIRRLGDLPRDLNADRELMERVVTGVKAALSGDAPRVLLDERTAGETRILILIENALGQNPPDSTRSALQRIRDEVWQMRERLKAEKSRG